MTDITPQFQDISPSTKGPPSMGDWYLANTTGGITEDNLPWMLAQGWTVTGTIVAADGTRTYTMQRITLQNWNILQELLTDFTNAYNEGRDNNQKRYEDVVRVWSEMLDKSQTHLDDAKSSLDNRIDLYFTTLNDLDDDYNDFYADVQADLDALTATLNADRTRVNDQFDALVSQSNQNLLDRGFYSSGMTSTITAGIEERRALALTEISEREQRLIAEITLRKNQIYRDVLGMRASLVDARMGLENRKQEFLAYQLSERNSILAGLFSFVERRVDGYPDLGSLAQLTASLAETGAATWQST
ncbi:MAG: hypothetical protein AAF745_00180 [Planctomycetota bacterium]